MKRKKIERCSGEKSDLEPKFILNRLGNDVNLCFRYPVYSDIEFAAFCALSCKMTSKKQREALERV